MAREHRINDGYLSGPNVERYGDLLETILSCYGSYNKKKDRIECKIPVPEVYNKNGIGDMKQLKAKTKRFLWSMDPRNKYKVEVFRENRWVHLYIS